MSRSRDQTDSSPSGRSLRRTGAAAISSTHAWTRLQNQALGALINHAQITAAPPQLFLDDLAAFQNTRFSSRRVERLAKEIAAGTIPLPDPDPVLDPFEEQGKAVFTRACAHCHGNPEHPSTTTSLPQSIPGKNFNRYHDIRTSCPRPIPPPAGSPAEDRGCPARPTSRTRFERTRSHCPHGAKVRRTSSDPGRLLAHRRQLRVPEVRRSEPPRHQQDRSLLHQQQREDPRGCPPTVPSLLRPTESPSPDACSTGLRRRQHRRDQQGPSLHASGGGCPSGLPPKAVDREAAATMDRQCRDRLGHGHDSSARVAGFAMPAAAALWVWFYTAW